MERENEFLTAAPSADAEASKTVPRRLLRRYLFTGLTALLPTLLTILVFLTVWQYAHDTIGARMTDAMSTAFGFDGDNAILRLAGDAAAVVIFLAVAMVVGLVLTSFIGAKLFKVIETSFTRLPFVSSVYRPIRQVTDFFLTEKQQFRRVVAVEYPRKGIYSIGFVTSSGFKDVRTPDGGRMISIFLPSSPAPFTGYVILARESETIPLSIIIDDAIRFTVSGGVILPMNQITENDLPLLEQHSAGDE